MSIPFQGEACRRFIEECGWAAGEVYADVASGKGDDRREFQRLLAEALQGRFQAVVVYKYSRFGRDLVNSVVYERELLELVFEKLVVGEERIVRPVLREPFRLLEARKGPVPEAFRGAASSAVKGVVSGEA